MSPQSLYLCGVSEVRVEMKVAPFRALTQPNGISRYTSGLVVEMRVAPFRALTHSYWDVSVRVINCRNEGCPIQGICKISGINSLGFFSCTKTPKEA